MLGSFPRKLVFLAAALAVLIAAYAAAGFWLVPRIVRAQAQQFAEENYQRKLAIGEIRFNPFTFELAVDRFSFPDADGKPLARFDTLLVNLELSSLWRAGASFKEISIGKPYIRPVIRRGRRAQLCGPRKALPETPESEADRGAATAFHRALPDDRRTCALRGPHARDALRHGPHAARARAARLQHDRQHGQCL